HLDPRSPLKGFPGGGAGFGNRDGFEQIPKPTPPVPAASPEKPFKPEDLNLAPRPTAKELAEGQKLLQELITLPSAPKEQERLALQVRDDITKLSAAVARLRALK